MTSITLNESIAITNHHYYLYFYVSCKPDLLTSERPAEAKTGGNAWAGART